jgi:hypothetical protein
MRPSCDNAPTLDHAVTGRVRHSRNRELGYDEDTQRMTEHRLYKPAACGMACGFAGAFRAPGTSGQIDVEHPVIPVGSRYARVPGTAGQTAVG